MPSLTEISAVPFHSLLTPIGKAFVITALSSGYLTPVSVTPVHLSVSEKTEREYPFFCGTIIFVFFKTVISLLLSVILTTAPFAAAYAADCIFAVRWSSLPPHAQ